MKRTIIALSVAAAVALPVAAQAAPKVYGKINLSAESYKKTYENPATKADEFTREVSNASRFGVKGEDELTATLSAVYGIEWEVGMDGEDPTGGTTGKADLAQRNRFVGIKSVDFGTIKLGKYDTYLKLAQGEIDLFNDYEGDMKYVIAGENRINNAIGYESPSFAGLTVNFMTQTQDNSSTTGNTGKRTNGHSASVVYKNEDIGLYAALAADFSIVGSVALNAPTSTVAPESDNLRLVVSYTVADLTLNGIYQTSEPTKGDLTGNKDLKEAGWQLGAAYKLGDETLKVQYGVADADSSTAAVQQHTLLSVGVDHNFTKGTKAFVWYTQKEEDKLAALADTKISVAAVGIEHKF